MFILPMGMIEARVLLRQLRCGCSQPLAFAPAFFMSATVPLPLTAVWGIYERVLAKIVES